MGRRVRLPAVASTSRFGPVTVRAMSQPRNGWTLEQAVDLVEQGYTPAHVQQLTGWHAQQLKAQQRRRSRAGAA